MFNLGHLPIALSVRREILMTEVLPRVISYVMLRFDVKLSRLMNWSAAQLSIQIPKRSLLKMAFPIDRGGFEVASILSRGMR
jgi:hypothetical protein